MAPPHRGVVLMAAVAAASVLLTLLAPVTSARLRNAPGTLTHGVYEKGLDLGTAPLTMTDAECWNTLKVLQAFAAAMPSLGWCGDDFCSWSGVRCSEGNVGFVVGDDVITGTLPEMPDDVDYSMVKLDHIVLFGQNWGLTGTLPSSWGKLRKVRALCLGSTRISGTLPSAWRTMDSLRFLRLSFTNVGGTLPSTWSSMEAIEEIVLSNTEITGTLPESWSALPNLRRIYVEQCKLYGSLPESWAHMPMLERLRLHNNSFCGCVPDSWLASPTLLTGVDARYRRGSCVSAQGCAQTTTTTPAPLSDLQCSVPMCLSCLPRDSNLCGVCIDGYVLTDDWQCTKSPEWEAVPYAMSEAERVNTLRVLQAFAAAMPALGWSGDNFCSWSGVTCFDANVSIIVSRSWVTGTLPEMPHDVDYSMVRLDQIHLFGKHSGITGTLPDSWGKLQRMRAMRLGYTRISGTLPAAWSSMEAIEQINISCSQITGTLPEAWGALPNLRRIYLQRCNLYGSLPESWARMPSLERLALHENNFCGCLPESWLTSPTLLMAVDVKHRKGNCWITEACTEKAIPPTRGQELPQHHDG